MRQYILISDNGRWVVKERDGSFVLWNNRTTPVLPAHVWTTEEADRDHMYQVLDQWDKSNEITVFPVRLPDLAK